MKKMFFDSLKKLEEYQREVNIKKDAFDNSLDEDHKKKVKAIGEAMTLFKEANLTVQLYAIHETWDSKGEKVAVQYNNFADLVKGEEIIIVTKKIAHAMFGLIFGFVEQFLGRYGFSLPSMWEAPSLYFDFLLNYAGANDSNESEKKFLNKLRIIKKPLNEKFKQ